MFAVAIAMLLQATVAFATVAQGSDSQIMEPREVVVRSPEDWQTLWGDHSPSPAPTVDFSRFLVAGIFLGSRSTAGYGVEIISVRAERAATVIEYRERRSPPGALAAQVLTAPYLVLRLPRDIDRVEFRKTGPTV